MKTQTNFLKLKDVELAYLSKDGTYWIALPPILVFFGISLESRLLKDIKKDPILGPARAVLTVQVSNADQKQGRKMTCLPEHFIYGWLFTLPNNSPEIIAYKKECYNLLYQHFHGAITGRREMLQERYEVERAIAEKKLYLQKHSTDIKELKLLESRSRNLKNNLDKLDQNMVLQGDLFSQNTTKT
jgi:hypothetical protein